LVIGARAVPKLSMSVMIGLPAVSVALLSVWLILAGTRTKWGAWLMPLAGGLFACSMQIKLFTFILAPMAICILWKKSQRTISIVGCACPGNGSPAHGLCADHVGGCAI
jgi:hypothetical protein